MSDPSPVFRWDVEQRHPDGRLVLMYRHARIIDEFVRPGMDVLDVGGWGSLAKGIIESGARCTILDMFTADQCYPERVRALPHVVGDVLDSGCFPAQSFDLVTCCETMEHVGDIPAALANMRHWLRDDGWLVGTVPMPGHIHDGDPTCQILTDDGLSAAIMAAGFEFCMVSPTPSISSDDDPIGWYFRAYRGSDGDP